MLQIIGGSQIASDDYYIKHMQNGLDELHFEVSIYDPIYREIYEESKIYESTERQTYVVKTVSGSKKTAKIGCRLDLTPWQGTVHIGFREKATAKGFLENRNVWTVEGEDRNEERWMEMKAPTPLEVAMQVQESFGVALRFDTDAKSVRLVWYKDAPLSNAYVVDTVNLRSAPEFKGKSSERYNRLYPIGKNGLQIGGDGFVECRKDGEPVICAVWEDNRYTNAEELRADAQKRVYEAAQPIRSWKLQVIDLQKIDPVKWKDLNLDLFTKLKLIDAFKGFTVDVQVMEDKIFPYYPEKNEITVSNQSGSIQKTMKTVCDQIYNPNSSFYQKMNAKEAL